MFTSVYVRVILLLPIGTIVHLLVEDTGCGINESTVKRIFDLYATSKGWVRALVLGLSVTHRIIQDHNGHMRVESAPGLGTTFHTLLPTAKFAEAAVPGYINDTKRSKESSLVVDDDLAVATTLSKSLQSLAYRTCIETSPFAAASVVRQEPKQFELVVTDQRMPEMNDDRCKQIYLGFVPNRLRQSVRLQRQSEPKGSRRTGDQENPHEACSNS